MTARTYFGGFGFRGAAKLRKGTKRRPAGQRTLGIRTVSLEQLEERTLLNAAGRPMPPGDAGDNIAHECSYTWNVAPNYTGGCTESGDVTQLTDEQYASGSPIWSQTPLVGWMNNSPIDVVIDLGYVQPIQGVYVHMHGGSSQVYWPTEIHVKVSNDNINWYNAVKWDGYPADLVDMDPNPPQYGTYAPHDYLQLDTLDTFGRYVKFDIVTGTSPNYVFVDEIQVFRGADSRLTALAGNIALGCGISAFSPSPNNPTDANDATELTDGSFFSGSLITMWQGSYAATWAKVGAMQMTIDLGQDEPIEGVSFTTSAGIANVEWPSVINVLVSTDNTNFYDAGDVIRLSADHGLPQSFDSWTYYTERLNTHGRYVKLVVGSTLYLCTTEIEVYHGRPGMLSMSYQQDDLVDDVNEFFISSEQNSLGIRRIVFDAQDIKNNIADDSNLTSQQKSQYTATLDGYIMKAMYDTTSNDLVLPISTVTNADLHKDVFKVQALQWQADGWDELVAWLMPSSWDWISPTQAPSGIAASIDATLMKHEERSFAVNITNPTSTDINVGTPSITWSGTAPSSSDISIRKVEWTDTTSSDPTLAAIVDIPGGGLVIPAGMTCQLWVTFNTATTNAGSYSGTLDMTGLPGNVPVALEVSSLVFPSETTLGAYGWDYIGSPRFDATESNGGALYDELTEHSADVVWATGEGISADHCVMKEATTPDFDEFDEWVTTCPDARSYRISLNCDDKFGPSWTSTGPVVGTQNFNDAVNLWITAYVDHWNEIGLSLDRIVLQIKDEPTSEAAADLVSGWASAIHAANSNIQIFANPLFADPTAAYAQEMLDNVDILCLNRQQFLAGSDPFRRAYQEQVAAGKTLEFYSCEVQTYMLDPYNYYRLQAWTGFKEGATGMGYWAFCDQGNTKAAGGDWSWATNYPMGISSAPLFLASDSVAEGKAMEAIHEGIEDYQYLQMLKDKIELMAAEGCPPGAIQAAQSFLAAAVDTVVTSTDATPRYNPIDPLAAIEYINWYIAKDRTTADTVRIQVLEMLEALSAYPSPVFVAQPADQVIELGQTATFRAAAAGSVSMTYQWQQYSGGSWSNISGATTTYYTTTWSAVAGDDGKQFRVVVTNSHGSVTSDAATLHVNYDLEARWRLNETTGTSAADFSGNGHTGTLTNGPDWSDGELHFDGLNDYVSVPAPTQSLLIYGGYDLTLSAWIDLTDDYNGYLFSKPWNDAGQYNYRLYLNNGKISFSLQTGFAQTKTITTPDALTDSLHHVAATVDVSDVMTIYIDGVAVVSGTHSITTWLPNDIQYIPLTLGTLYPYGDGWGGNTSYSFEGSMRDARLYTHALSAEAIADMSSSAVATWRLNTGAGTYAWDATGNVNTGTLINGTAWETNGAFDTAVSFDGSNDSINVPETSGLVYSGHDMTLSAWVYIDPNEASGGYLISKYWNQTNKNYYLCLNTNHTVSFYLGGYSVFDGFISEAITTPSALSTGAWHHVAATVDGNNALLALSHVMTVYVDGVAVVAGNFPTNYTMTWSAWLDNDHLALAIGTMYPYDEGWGGNPSASFQGRMDQVRVYRSALSPSDIAALAMGTSRVATIIDQPIDQAVDVGQKPTFMVYAWAAATLSYQWQQYSGGSWSNIGGATGATYTYAGATSSGDDGKQYRVLITNTYGTVISDVVTLHVNYGLEGAWKLDETTGTSAADASGNGHTGTLTCGPTWASTGGILNGAVSLDGTNDYISVPDAAVLKYTGGDLTLSTWVKIDASETDGGFLISKYWNGSYGIRNYYLRLNSNDKVSFFVGGNGSKTITTLEALSTGTWHHVAATVDSAKVMTIYVDGVAMVTDKHLITDWTPTYEGQSYSDLNVPLAIGTLYPYGGGWGGNTTYSFKGMMDNVRVYTQALSPEGIAEQARCPVGFWKLNETTGTSAADSSGNAYTGTLLNTSSPWTTGYINNGIQLDGSNDYISVPDVQALKYTGGGLTLSTWIKADAGETDDGYLISKYWNGTVGIRNYYLRLNSDDKVSFFVGGNGTYTITTPNALSGATWHHVAATVDSAKVMTIYVDGVAVVTDEHSITDWTPTYEGQSYSDLNVPLAIGTFYPYGGGWGGNTAYSFDGAMDEVHVYNTALNAADVKVLAFDPPSSGDQEDKKNDKHNDRAERLDHGRFKHGPSVGDFNAWGAMSLLVPSPTHLSSLWQTIVSPANRAVESPDLAVAASHVFRSLADDDDFTWLARGLTFRKGIDPQIADDILAAVDDEFDHNVAWEDLDEFMDALTSDSVSLDIGQISGRGHAKIG